MRPHPHRLSAAWRVNIVSDEREFFVLMGCGLSSPPWSVPPVALKVMERLPLECKPRLGLEPIFGNSRDRKPSSGLCYKDVLFVQNILRSEHLSLQPCQAPSSCRMGGVRPLSSSQFPKRQRRPPPLSPSWRLALLPAIRTLGTAPPSRERQSFRRCLCNICSAFPTLSKKGSV